MLQTTHIYILEVGQNKLTRKWVSLPQSQIPCPPPPPPSRLESIIWMQKEGGFGGSFSFSEKKSLETERLPSFWRGLKQVFRIRFRICIQVLAIYYQKPDEFHKNVKLLISKSKSRCFCHLCDNIFWFNNNKNGKVGSLRGSGSVRNMFGLGTPVVTMRDRETTRVFSKEEFWGFS